MRVHQRALLLTVAACAAITAAARPAAAQGTSNGRMDQAAIRLGAYFPTNSKIKSQIGNTFAVGGVDVTVERNGPTARTIFSVDYLQREDHDRKLQMIPVTFGQQWYQTSRSLQQSTMYFGWGAGAYFTDINVINDAGTAESKNQTLFGGYLNLGADLYQGLFLDARYHITSTVGAANPGGFELTMGYRF